MEMTPLVVNPHALAGDGRLFYDEPFRPRETLGRYVTRIGAIVPHDVWVWHNGVMIPEGLWPYLIPRQGDQIVMRVRVRGGGNGGWRIVAMIGIAILAAYTGGLAAMAYTGTSTVAAATSSLGGELMFYGVETGVAIAGPIAYSETLK